MNFEQNEGFEIEREETAPDNIAEELCKENKQEDRDDSEKFADFLTRAFCDPESIVDLLLGIVEKFKTKIYQDRMPRYILEILEIMINEKNIIILRSIFLVFLAVEDCVQQAVLAMYKSENAKKFINVFITSLQACTMDLIKSNYDEYSTEEYLEIYTVNFSNCWCNKDYHTLSLLSSSNQ